MALRWLTDSARAAAAADAALSTGTAELWWQVRFTGAYLLDKPQDNVAFMRLGLFNTGTPSSDGGISEYRQRVSFRKRESTVDTYEIWHEAAFDATTARNLAHVIDIATLDPLLDREQWYTLYLRAWTTGTAVNHLRLIADDGTVVWSNDITDSASVLPLGDHTHMVVGIKKPELMEIDAIAFGTGELSVANRYVSPEVHGQALRYWLCEDGSGDTVAEGTGNGNAMVFNLGVEGTDYEWFTGDWGAAGEAVSRAILASLESLTPASIAWDLRHEALAQALREQAVHLESLGAAAPVDQSRAVLIEALAGRVVQEVVGVESKAGALATLTPHLEALAEAGDGIGLDWEAVARAVGVEAPPLESRSGQAATRTPRIEALGAADAARGPAWEALAEAAGERIAPLEWLAQASDAETLDVEALAAPSAPTEIPTESLAGADRTAAPPWEALASRDQATTPPVEALGGVQETKRLPLEALGTGEAVSRSEALAIETLGRAVREAQPGVESIQPVSATDLLPWEAGASVDAAAEIATESVQGILLASTGHLEATGRVLRSLAPHFESMAPGAVSRAIGTAFEALGRVDREEALGVEAGAQVGSARVALVEWLLSASAEASPAVEAEGAVRVDQPVAMESLADLARAVAASLEAGTGVQQEGTVQVEAAGLIAVSEAVFWEALGEVLPPDVLHAVRMALGAPRMTQALAGERRSIVAVAPRRTLAETGD